MIFVDNVSKRENTCSLWTNKISDSIIQWYQIKQTKEKQGADNRNTYVNCRGDCTGSKKRCGYGSKHNADIQPQSKGSTERTYEFACMVIREDVARMDALGIENIVFHPGSHTGIRAKAGIVNIIAGLDQAITGQENLMILLETMSGKGTEIGRSFEELREIRDGVKHPEKIGICLDTCHVFAAGYDIVEDLDGVLREFDRILGISLLRAVHLNDSMMPFGSRKDRHAVFGGGEIGAEALLRVMEPPLLSHIPFYLETPLDDQGHKEEIHRIKEELAKRGKL